MEMKIETMYIHVKPKKALKREGELLDPQKLEPSSFLVVSLFFSHGL